MHKAGLRFAPEPPDENNASTGIELNLFEVLERSKYNTNDHSIVKKKRQSWWGEIEFRSEYYGKRKMKKKGELNCARGRSQAINVHS